MSTYDVYGMTDRLPDTILDVIAVRLEARGQHAAFQRMLHQYLDAMAIDETQSVLDLGCGTGVAAISVARRPGFRGTVVGIDLSAHLIATGRELAVAAGVGNRVSFLVGDSRELELADGTFDAVIAHTLISHVDDPAAVLAEMRRVVKPGGLIGIFDGDYASLTFGQPDPDQGKSDDEAIQRAIITNPRVMRQLPGLLRSTGLELVTAFPNVVADIGRADFWIPAIESFRRLVPQAGAMSESETAAWADARLAESAEGAFFGASNYYAYVARRP